MTTQKSKAIAYGLSTHMVHQAMKPEYNGILQEERINLEANREVKPTAECTPR